MKLLAGSMIREMLSSGVLLDEFWQSDTRSDLYSKFPRGQHHNSQWVTSFEEFVDELVLEKILTQESVTSPTICSLELIVMQSFECNVRSCCVCGRPKMEPYRSIRHTSHPLGRAQHNHPSKQSPSGNLHRRATRFNL